MKKFILSTLIFGLTLTSCSRNDLAENYFKETKCFVSERSQQDLVDGGIPKEGVKHFAERISKTSCNRHKNHIFVDFNKSSAQKRLFVINIDGDVAKVLYKSTVSHGKKSGNAFYANDFSNEVNSNKSSLGLFKIMGKSYENDRYA